MIMRTDTARGVTLSIVIALVLLLLLGSCTSNARRDATERSNKCSLLGDPHARETCFIHLALATKNRTICTASISDATFKEKCEEEFLFLVARQDPFRCEDAMSGRMADKCYGRLAFETENWQMCVNIERADAKDWCYMQVARLTRNESVCELATQDWKYWCMALISRNVRLCERIVEPEFNTFREDCFRNFSSTIQPLAISPQNLTVSSRSSDDRSGCWNISSDSLRDACYMKLVSSGQGEYCDNVVNPGLRDSCFSVAAAQTAGVALS